MKPVIIIMFVIFWKSCHVHSFALFDSISAKVNEVTNKLINTLRTYKNRIIRFMFPDIVSSNEVKVVKCERKSKIKKSLKNFVEEKTVQSDSELNIYSSLKSNPAVFMSTPQLATLHGKRIESHVVLTKDGYLLTLHRLKNFNSKNDKDRLNLTILLHHGLLGSSADWILLGPEKSLPYLLSNAGYDVWLANARGNYYSRGHTSKMAESKEFWNFSWQEIGTYDLPAVVDYIKKINNKTEQINFIGHSMGATAFLVMLATFPEYNAYFRMGIVLAPLAFMAHTESPLRMLTSLATDTPDQIMKLLGRGEFVPNRLIPLWIANKYCNGTDVYCSNPLLFLSNSIPAKDTWDKSLAARVLYHVPAGGSTNTLLHYVQLIKSGKFHKFNNELEEFDLQLVKVPIVLISSSDDKFATTHDILKLYFSIACPLDHHIIRGKQLNHLGLLWSPKANTVVFEKIVDFLNADVSCNASLTNNQIS